MYGSRKIFFLRWAYVTFRDLYTFKIIWLYYVVAIGQVNIQYNLYLRNLSINFTIVFELSNLTSCNFQLT